jgi:hypothetical protein
MTADTAKRKFPQLDPRVRHRLKTLSALIRVDPSLTLFLAPRPPQGKTIARPTHAKLRG